MINVEKGFQLKGLTIGEDYGDGIIVGIDDSIYGCCDVAVLSNKPREELTMAEVVDDDDLMGTLYGLEEYKNSKYVTWKNSPYCILRMQRR